MPSRTAAAFARSALLVLFALAVALPGCRACSRDPAAPAGPATLPIVRVQAMRMSPSGETNRILLGSGFVVSDTGHLVTAFHVLENFRELAESAAGDPIALVAQPATAGLSESDASGPAVTWLLRTLGEDPPNDLALLEVVGGLPGPDSRATPLEVARLALAPPAPETAVELAGYPFGATALQTRSGRILVSASALPELGRSFDAPSWFDALGSGGFLLAEVETHRGNSGSPVSRSDTGAVVGLCSAILLLDRSRPAWADEAEDEAAAPYTLVIPSRSIAALLDRHGVEWQPAD
jgi:S1-C subfamily serine protease